MTLEEASKRIEDLEARVKHLEHEQEYQDDLSTDPERESTCNCSCSC